tara:strand:+ start:23624 stop:24136 length:513 start_codon:yes stop_codon:yes gene_type:complete
MKISGLLPYFFLIILAVFTFYSRTQHSKQIDRLESKIETLNQNNTITPEADFELATAMGKLQYFANKLYFSLQNENTELIEFYTHELEETMEDIEAANVIDEGVSISDNIETYGLKGLSNFERFMEQSPEKFEDHYSNLINACNACHMVSKHGFINITIPTLPVVSNQKF